MTKYDLVYDFITNYVTNAQQAKIVDYAATEGICDTIDDMDFLDDGFTASEILKYDLSDFDINDDYYVYDNINALVSSDWIDDLIDYVGDWESIAKWIVETESHCWVDDLAKLLTSDEYREAEAA